MRLNVRFFLMLFVAGTTGLASCKKDVLQREMLTPEQLIAGRLSGTWINPGNIITPDNVPAEVFGTMRLVITSDETGKPSKFLAQDCPIIFGNADLGTWQVTGTEDSAKVNVTGVGPVDEFTARVSSNSLTISFFMGWENTDTKVKGKGNFRVTLTRQ